MNKIKLTRIAPLSAGKIMCFMYFIVGVLAAMLMCIAAPLATPGKAVSMAAAAGIVIGYPIAGFIGGIIGAAIYNLASSCFGGMEIQLSAEEHSER